MKVATYAYLAVASLGVLVVATLRVRPHLPEPFHLLDGGWLIEIGLLVYAASLSILLLTVSGMFRIGEIVRSERIVLAISSVIIVIYCGYVSAALFGLSQATDL